MNANTLREDELYLVEATIAGKEANFSDKCIDGNPGGTIRADILRRLMLGLPVTLREGEDEQVIDVPGPGIRLVQAHIAEGDLNLEYGCMGNGEELPRLSLEECYVPGIILMRSARLRRLCLYGSRINLVLAHQAYISGQLDIREVKSADSKVGCQEQGLCRFGLRGAHIGDGIDARRATLASAPARAGYVKYAARARYALDLAEARIEGDVRLFPDFEAFGGVNMNGAQIKGSVQAHGAMITAEEMYAFDVSNAVIEGRIALDTREGEADEACVRFRGKGEFRFSNANLMASLNMTGAYIEGEIKADLIKTPANVIFATYHHTKRKPLEVLEFTCTESIDLRGARIGGNLDCHGANVGGGLDVSNCHIQGHALLVAHHAPVPALHKRFVCEGELGLRGARIDADLNLEGARLRQGMDGKGLHVDGYCYLRLHSDFDNYSFESDGPIQLNDAFVGFDLDLSGAHLRDELVASNIRIGGKVLMRMPEPAHGKEFFDKRFVAEKKVDLSGAQIQNSFYLCGATLAKGLRFRGGNIKGALIIYELSGGGWEKIGKNNKLTQVRNTIDLINSHANIVSDFLDGKLQYGDGFTLKLEGFTYGRFRTSGDYESLTETEAGWLKRLYWNEKVPMPARPWEQWLSLQYDNENRKPDQKTYRPDAYNTLFLALKRIGMLLEADNVLAHKLRIERGLKLKSKSPVSIMVEYPLLLLHDLMFKFGLSPARATSFYMGYIAVLATTISLLNGPQQLVVPSLGTFDVPLPSVMVVHAQPQASVMLSSAADHHKTNSFLPLAHPDIGTFLTEAPCGDRINPFLYALEMSVPGLDLNQRSTCDVSTQKGGLWPILKGLATIAGWLMTSLFILTWSGVIRRRTEPAS